MDPRLLPAYSMTDAARCIGAHPATLRTWFKGRSYPTKDGPRRSPNLLVAAAKDALSFQNLIQAHVVQGIRKKYHIPMYRIREALAYLRDSMGSLDLLASEKFYHDTEHLLLKVSDRLISLSERGQTVSETILQQYLHRIDYGADGFASRLHPFLYTATGQLYEPRHIMIDPTIAFGKPCLQRLGVKTEIIADRFLAGEPIEDLIADYGAEPEEIQEAIRWSTRKAA
ncbi:MAG: DUF433 domain-containing protein [Opitutaceae bacterium]|nr:DUF433 domain-containing protein [Opitutaceae bacterium]MBP9912966.1 DUF433 domain-containing protein [Opitutaceae bacterium]